MHPTKIDLPEPKRVQLVKLLNGRSSGVRPRLKWRPVCASIRARLTVITSFRESIGDSA